MADATSILSALTQKQAQVQSGVTNFAKGLFGAIQTAKANKGIKKLLANQVEYKRPEEYAQELAMRQGMAAQTQMPGQAQLESNIASAGASARAAAEKGAISSNVYNRSVGDIFSKTLKAYQDLGVQAATWQQAQKENLAGVLQRGAGYSDTEWQQNKLYPWEMQMNMLQAQKQAGSQMAWGALEDQQVNANNYAGTQYAQQMMNSLQSKGINLDFLGGGKNMNTNTNNASSMEQVYRERLNRI